MVDAQHVVVSPEQLEPDAFEDADAELEGPGGPLSEATLQMLFDTPELREAIHAVVHGLAHGEAVSVVTHGTELSPQQAADVLGVSRKLINRMLDEGRLAFRHLPASRHKKIPATEITRLLHDRRATRAGIEATVDALDELDLPY